MVSSSRIVDVVALVSSSRIVDVVALVSSSMLEDCSVVTSSGFGFGVFLDGIKICGGFVQSLDVCPLALWCKNYFGSANDNINIVT